MSVEPKKISLHFLATPAVARDLVMLGRSVANDPRWERAGMVATALGEAIQRELGLDPFPQPPVLTVLRGGKEQA